MDFSDKAHAMNPTGKGCSWWRLTLSAGASPRPLESRTVGNLVRKRVRLWGRGAFWASGLSPTSPFLSYPNPIRHRGQGPGSARTHRLRKEKAFLVPVAGGRPGSLTPHDPPHPAALGVHRPAKEAKSVLPARWAWETQQPFALAQVDVKDIRDEATLGPRLVHYRTQARLPRSQCGPSRRAAPALGFWPLAAGTR